MLYQLSYHLLEPRAVEVASPAARRRKCHFTTGSPIHVPSLAGEHALRRGAIVRGACAKKMLGTKVCGLRS